MLYPAGILTNVATGRFHPILYRQAPLPGGKDAEMGAQRFKSLGHHTEGFDTIEEAEASLKDDASKGVIDSGLRLNWEGADVPADVQWFSVDELLKRTAA